MMDLLGIPLPVLMGQLLIGLINGAFYAVLSLGLALIFGLLNIVNFAHGALYMVGAFVAFLLLDVVGIGYWPALILSPLIVGAFGMVIERFLLRPIADLDHLYGLLLTFGLALLLEGTFRQIYGVSGETYAIPASLQGGFNLGFMFLPVYRAWVIVASIVVCGATWFLIEMTRLGATMRAAVENADLVRAFGVNVPLLVTLTYGLGVALAAFAGVPRGADLFGESPHGLEHHHRGLRHRRDRRARVDQGGDRLRLPARPVRGANPRLLPGSIQHHHLRGHGHRADRASGRPLRKGELTP